MADRFIFLTGRLARPRLEKVLAGLGETEFDWEIIDTGVKIAALMTEEIIKRRVKLPEGTSQVIVPGRFRGEPERLGAHFGVPFLRGPDEVADLPAFLGREGKPPDLSRHDLRIFAEIVDASELSMEALVSRAKALSVAGADVIDLGCLPDTPFPHLGEAVQALKALGFAVSVDSADIEELREGAKAGADYLLSLTEHTLDLVHDYATVPILIPSIPGDLASLDRAMEAAEKKGLRFIADPVLDPIHFGFAASLQRFAETRRRWPDAELLMGTGNLTELTDADSAGLTAALLGFCSELSVQNVLVVNVSPHTNRTVEEHDLARRIMFAARTDGSLPRNYHPGLLQVHDRRPFPASVEEIEYLAGEVRDANFRIMTAPDGIHVFNSKGHFVAQDAFELFPKLGVEADGAHAFYLGAELMKAEIAWRLGKRYAQDEPLSWGVAAPEPEVDRARLAEAGHTLRAKQKDK
ncbi:dihydropteroate synthase-like protein [Mesorhizobium sp. J18]|uniref:DUF6513 domain-containing protein n=1 Tax=Mesorhizobium sp. J18 TaxID=935263 RepID=UPI00119A9608|nr:DUF6513 domain-containing protein [Mesorhizobium sp. J18]TWG94962.1 dihydropteroate synthase-like protein [Mesorhizobium sp. J18]